MGRPPGSRNKPKDGTAEIGDNSAIKELTPEQKRSLLLRACEQISPLKDEIATVTGEIRQIYKTFKAHGLPKKDLDLALAYQRMDQEEALEEASRRSQIFEWCHPGLQAELFEAAAE